MPEKSGKKYCEPIRINSSLVSAQMRDRLYWCNWSASQPKDKRVLLQDVPPHVGRNDAAR
jgi:hypothetical protein